MQWLIAFCTAFIHKLIMSQGGLVYLVLVFQPTVEKILLSHSCLWMMTIQCSSGSTVLAGTPKSCCPLTDIYNVSVIVFQALYLGIISQRQKRECAIQDQDSMAGSSWSFIKVYYDCILTRLNTRLSFPVPGLPLLYCCWNNQVVVLYIF